jgi:hypothetical protein
MCRRSEVDHMAIIERRMYEVEQLNGRALNPSEINQLFTLKGLKTLLGLDKYVLSHFKYLRMFVS